MIPLPCIYLGEPVSSRYAATNGYSTQREWRHCLHAEKPLGLLVCPCRCKRCSLYAPEEDGDHANPVVQ